MDITFFVPCYNEEENIGNTVSAIEEAMASFPRKKFEILVIDDGSEDHTVGVVKKLMEKNRNLRLILSEGHRGLGFNYFRGSFFAKGKYYMLINGDNVEPPETIRRIVSRAGEADMIIPHFGDGDKRNSFRRSVSWTFTRLVNTVSKHALSYFNGPVLHLTENVRFWRAETVGYGYQAELLCRLLNEGKSYLEVEVQNADRERGFSNAFSLSNVLSVSNSLFHIYWRRLEYGVLNLMQPGVTPSGEKSSTDSSYEYKVQRKPAPKSSKPPRTRARRVSREGHA